MQVQINHIILLGEKFKFKFISMEFYENMKLYMQSSRGNCTNTNYSQVRMLMLDSTCYNYD